MSSVSAADSIQIANEMQYFFLRKPTLIVERLGGDFSVRSDSDANVAKLAFVLDQSANYPFLFVFGIGGFIP